MMNIEVVNLSFIFSEGIKGLLTLGIIGVVFSVILIILNEKLKVKEDPLVEEILKVLPGVDCGACGFPSCKMYGLQIIKERKLNSFCKVGGREVTEKIANILNIKVTPESSFKMVAVVRCGAEIGEKKVSTIYRGPKSCRFAHLVGGNIDCKYGCLGLGDCVDVCPVGAISIKKGKAEVDIKKCIGCGRCIEVCPRNLLTLVPVLVKEQQEEKLSVYYVACNNKEKALYVKNVCSRGCLGCGICTRTKNSPFYLQENLAYLDYKRKADSKLLEEIRNKCPTKCIERNES